MVVETENPGFWLHLMAGPHSVEVHENDEPCVHCNRPWSEHR